MSAYKNVLRTAEMMKELDCYKVDGYDDRILVQKKMFLACRCGIGNDFEFIWGLRGVYSAELNLVSHTILKHDPNYLKKYKLSGREHEIAKYINGLTKEIKKNELEISELDWYELLADILYLRDQGYEKEHIFDTLAQDGIEGSMKEYKLAYKICKKGRWNKD